MHTPFSTRSFRLLTLLFFILIFSVDALSQRVANVSAKYTYILSEDDDVTIKGAKLKAIELAKAEALKKEFGMLVVSDFINTDRAINDEFTSYYMSDTQSSVKGEWLGDDRDPEVTIEYIDGDLFFTAEVWGKAREIVRAKPDIKWQVQKDVNAQRVDADQFDSGERFFVKFRSPSDGYLAVYLITGDNETACLLPYRKDATGRYQVKGGKEYMFFDKTVDPLASYYKLSTDKPLEYDHIVIIFSPNPFTKCMDTSNDPRRPNTLDSKDFAKWLLKNQRADNEMFVDRKPLTIKGAE